MKKMLQALALAIVFSTVPLFGAESGTTVTFDDFLKQYTALSSATEQTTLLETFWSGALKRDIPFVAENKREATFLYRGMDSVRVIGDFTSWAFGIPMKRLPNSDLWYLKLAFEPDARLDYKFVIKKDKTILDPHNPRTAPSRDGVRSELAMPEFVAAAELDAKPTVAKGTLTTMTVESKVLGYNRRVAVYIPAAYERMSDSLPVAYFQDGGDYLEWANAATVFDNLIAAKAIVPTIGVFIFPPTEPKRNRATEYSLNAKYESFVATELIPLIDKKYRTERRPQARLAVGSSLGGLISLSLALNNHDLIANAASQSGFLSFKNDTITTLFTFSMPKPLRIYLGVGTYEKNVAAVQVVREADLLSAHRRFVKMQSNDNIKCAIANFAMVMAGADGEMNFQTSFDGFSHTERQTNVAESSRGFAPHLHRNHFFSTDTKEFDGSNGNALFRFSHSTPARQRLDSETGSH